MHIQGTLAANFRSQLTNGLNKGLRFNITHSTTDFHDSDIGTFGTIHNAAFDFIGNMGNNLNRSPQEISATFAFEDLFVHFTRGKVVALGHASADKPLIMTQVKVSLSTIISNKYFTVLDRAHGAGIDVNIRIQFQHSYFKAPCL